MTGLPDSPPRIAILGCGNPSRGDDALGPALLERVEEWARTHPGRPMAIAQDFQLQVEHALDMAGCDLVVFVDARVEGSAPLTFRRVEPSRHASFSTHALSPGALLRAFNTLGCGEAPASFALGIRGHSFDLGKPLSAQARENLELAWGLLVRLLESPTESDWQQQCTADEAA